MSFSVDGATGGGGYGTAMLAQTTSLASIDVQERGRDQGKDGPGRVGGVEHGRPYNEANIYAL